MSSLLEGIGETIIIRGRAANAAEQIRKRSSSSSNYNSTMSSTSLCNIGSTSSPSRMTFSAASFSPSKCTYTLSRRTFHADPAPSPFPPRTNSSFSGSACASNNYSPYHRQGHVHRSPLSAGGGALPASASSSPTTVRGGGFVRERRATSLKETDDTNPTRFFVSRPSLSLGQVGLKLSPRSKGTSTSNSSPATAAEQPSTSWDTKLRSPYTLRQPKTTTTTTRATTVCNGGVGIVAGQRPLKTRPPPLSPTATAAVVATMECIASMSTSENANVQKESQILLNKNQPPQTDVDVGVTSTKEEEDLVSTELLSWRGQLLRSLQRISKIKADVALRLTYGKVLLAYGSDVSDSTSSFASQSPSRPSQKEEMGLLEERSRRLCDLLELCETALTEHSHNMIMMKAMAMSESNSSLRKGEADAVRSAMMTLAEEAPTLLLYTNVANNGKGTPPSDIVAKCAPTTTEKSSPSELELEKDDRGGTAKSHHHYIHTHGRVAADGDRGDGHVAYSTRRELTSQLPHEEKEKQEVEGRIKQEKASLSRDFTVDEDEREEENDEAENRIPPPFQEDETTKPPDDFEEEEAPRKRIGRVCPGRRRRLNLMTDEEMEAEAKAEAEAMMAAENTTCT